MEDGALIRRLVAEGVPKAAIARRVGVSRTTVIKAVASQGRRMRAKTSVFGDQVVVAAMIDRIVHHAEVIIPQRALATDYSATAPSTPCPAPKPNKNPYIETVYSSTAGTVMIASC